MGSRRICAGLCEARTFAEAFPVYEVVGTVQVIRSEDDYDVHVALADPADPTKTIVVEVADPACATTSPLLTTLSNAKTQFQALGGWIATKAPGNSFFPRLLGSPPTFLYPVRDRAALSSLLRLDSNQQPSG